MSDDVESTVATVLSDIFKLPIESIGPNTSTDTVEEWDSLKHLTVILSIEDEFDIQLEDEEAVRVTSYAVICEIVHQHLADRDRT